MDIASSFDPFARNPFEESLKQAQIWSRDNGFVKTDNQTLRPASSSDQRHSNHFFDRNGMDRRAAPDESDLYTSALRSLNLNTESSIMTPNVPQSILNNMRFPVPVASQQWPAAEVNRNAFGNYGLIQPPPLMPGPFRPATGMFESRRFYPQSDQQNRALVDVIDGPMRQIRGSSAVIRRPIDLSYDLNYQLDKCQEQLRLMERERRKGEQVFSSLFPDRKISGNNSIPIPKLPPKPCRVDRLIVEQIKEHARVFTLISLMEQLIGNFENEMMSKIHRWLEALRSLQTARQEELISREEENRNGCIVSLTQEESGPKTSFAVKTLCAATRTARTTFWCVVVTVLYRMRANRPTPIVSPSLSEEGEKKEQHAALTPRGDPVFLVSLYPSSLHSSLTPQTLQD